MIISRVKKYLTTYLFSTGVLGHIFLLASILLIPLIIQEPFGFFLERVSNTLAHSTHHKKQKLGTFLLKSGVINNWEKPSNESLFIAQPIPSWKGQGASINKQSNQNFDTFLDSTTHYVNSSKDLRTAIKQAQPGETILIMPGTYSFSGRSLPVTKPGKADAPIIVKSNVLGLAKIKLDLLEGFHIQAPHWVFENLNIQGNCNNDSKCEHAFHIVGKGHSFTLKNSIIHNFNAPIKVNGLKVSGKMYFPDNGLLEKNTFYNSKARQTANPVTLVNINSVNDWVVRGNLIADFSKAKGDRTSYGAFMKGNGKNGVFENNLIICEMNLPADRGIRIGLSLGGGGTGTEFCRDKDCSTEFRNGNIRNNVILNCSHDVGIYLNKAANSQIYNNLLFNNLGIDVRYSTSTATIYNNIISGRIKKRNGGRYTASHNIIDPYCLSSSRDFSDCSFYHWFWDLSYGDLNLVEGDEILGKGKRIKALKTDFCNNKLTMPLPDIGPIQYSNNLLCSPNNM